MKTLIFLVIFCLAIALPAIADDMFVSSLKAKVYSSPDTGSAAVSELKRGEKVNVISTQDSWASIEIKGSKGWVQKMFLSKNEPGKKISMIENTDQTSLQNVRKRASSSVTAASGRGLTGDNSLSSRARANNKNALSEEELKQVESIDVGEDVLIQFLSEGGLK